MAKRAWMEISEHSEIKLKRFFYFLRALFSAQWTLKTQQMPSVEFHYLLQNLELDAQYKHEIQKSH